MTSRKQRDDWQTLMAKGVDLIQQGQPQQALAQLERAKQQAPNDRNVRYWLANACRMNGEVDRAAGLFRGLLAERPGDFEVSFALAFLLRETGKPGEAAETLLQASAQPGLTIEQLLQVTGFLRDSNQYNAAIKVCEKAVKLKPDQADLHFKLGRLYQAIGAFDGALDSFRKTLELQPATGPAWSVLAQQKVFASSDDPDYVRIRAAAKQSHGTEADMCIAFAFGKALDDLQQWPEAWEQYDRGNRLASRAMPWGPGEWAQFVDRSTADSGDSPAEKPGSDRNAIFIVGMPRSGTTLVEQMLDRHPDITGRGELNFLAHFAEQQTGLTGTSQKQEMADYLWTQMRQDGPDSGSYIDKNPLNFRYLDTLFDLLPSARVLHVTRDGRDSCLSCFFQLFQHADAAFSYSLEHLVTFYSGYRRLMAHWERHHAGRIHQVSYHELVESSGDVLAKVLEFLGRDWDDAVTRVADEARIVRTASVWQARQPVHSRSVGRWRHYADRAPEFFDRLAAIDAEYDSGRIAQDNESETVK